MPFQELRREFPEIPRVAPRMAFSEFHSESVFFLFFKKLSGASFRRGDFAPREPEFGVEFWDANFFLAPNFGAEFWGRIFFTFGPMFSNK